MKAGHEKTYSGGCSCVVSVCWRNLWALWKRRGCRDRCAEGGVMAMLVGIDGDICLISVSVCWLL